MIASLTGELVHVGPAHVEVRVGPIVCELLVPASDRGLLQEGVGQSMTFYTIFYLEGDAARGNLEPRLIGFLRADDKRFFERFTTVKGIGPKRALRALARPIGEIAQAIESKDNRFLVQLPEIGKRTAEQVIAELSGKVRDFVTADVRATLPSTTGSARRTGPEEDAIAALMALGDRRTDAEQLLERAKAANPNLSSDKDLLREMLRLRNVKMG